MLLVHRYGYAENAGHYRQVGSTVKQNLTIREKSDSNHFVNYIAFSNEGV